MHTIDLRGVAMPALGLGTFPLRGAACARAVSQALELGYRHIDTAEMYGNEADVGAAVSKSGLKREEIFITSKVWPTNLKRDAVGASVRASLDKLKLDYLDLYLIHWPSRSIPLSETLGAMTEIKKNGFVRRIGVANFSVALMKEAVEKAGADIACNQVEYHVGLSQRRVLEYARAHGIALTSYSPLANGQLVNDPVLSKIGTKYGKSASQVALRWLIEQPGVAAIPKATSPENQRRNFDIFDFKLDAQDLKAISAFGGSNRVLDPGLAPDWDPE